MSTLHPKERTEITFGARFENAEILATSADTAQDVGELNNNDILPAFNAKFSIDEIPPGERHLVRLWQDLASEKLHLFHGKILKQHSNLLEILICNVQWHNNLRLENISQELVYYQFYFIKSLKSN